MISLFLKTKKFIPDEYHKTVQEIDFDHLYNMGFRLLLFDLDNTLAPYDMINANKEILDFLDNIKKKGFEIIIVSNNHKERLKLMFGEYQISYVIKAAKPFTKGYKKALKMASKSYKKEEIATIGDQLMTDVWSSKKMGYYSIVVNAIKRKTERWYTRFNRRIEAKMLKKIEKKYPDKYLELNLKEKR